MAREGSDRRVRKTRERIRQALTQLLLEKDLREITVRELAHKADINRGTFYLHFKDVYDLFDQVEEEVLEDFHAIIGKLRGQTPIVIMPILKDLFQYIFDNADMFIALLKTRETTFLDKIIQSSRPQTPEQWAALFPDGDEDHYEYYYTFLAFGCVAMLRRWFDQGMPESPEHMAALAEQLMVRLAHSPSAF